MSSAEIEDGVEQVPESLYRFFADEVFSALGPEVRQGLTTLSVAPLLDSELAVALLGTDVAESVCAAAIDVGLLVERERRLDLHPLARAFLEERSSQLGLVPREGAAGICLGIYRERHEWDAAFDLISRARLVSELEELMRAALDELLEAARLRRSRDGAISRSALASMRRCSRLRVRRRCCAHGRQVEAIAHAEAAAAGDSALEFRALSVAGRAAQLASREAEPWGSTNAPRLSRRLRRRCVTPDGDNSFA